MGALREPRPKITQVVGYEAVHAVTGRHGHRRELLGARHISEEQRTWYAHYQHTVRAVGQLNWTAGGFYYDGDSRSAQSVNLPGAGNIAAYLADRSRQIRSDLVNAAEMKRAAAAQIEEIDRRMQALPGELEALRAKGAEEIVAEEARIRAAAAAERDRLLEQARRDIDLQVKIAERELVSHAADLAVGVASERIRNSMTDDDQRRLVDRYVQQLMS